MTDHLTLKSRRLTAAAMVSGATLLAGSLALKTVNTEDARAMLDAVADAPGRFTASTMLQLLSALLLIPALLGFRRLAPGRLGATAIVLLYLNAIGNIGDAGFGAFVASAASDGVSHADVLTLTDAQNGAIYSVVSLFVLIGLLGFVLLAVALYRARTVPAAAPALIGASFLSFFAPIPEGIGGALMAVAFAVAAYRLAAPAAREMRAEGLEPPRLAATRT